MFLSELAHLLPRVILYLCSHRVYNQLRNIIGRNDNLYMNNRSTGTGSTGRISYINFLKFIGLTGIIIAHVGPPSWAFMLRSFDVPLMVILSSILASRSFAKYSAANASAADYYISRVKRLVIPTWIFLLFYFLYSFITTGQRASIKYYIDSFLLTRYGIGYVWIILVYLYSAMLIPAFAKLKLSVKGFIFAGLSYTLYEIAYYYKLGLNVSGFAKDFIDTTFYYIIPYGMLTYLGYNYFKMKNRTKLIIALVSFIVFIALAVYYRSILGSFQPVQITKYPPRLYYMSYGIGCSFTLLILCEKKNLKLYENRVIRFISSHSMWIYLWHILILDIYSRLKLPEIWFVKLIFVYMLSLLLVYTLNQGLDYVEKSHHFLFIQYLRG